MTSWPKVALGQVLTATTNRIPLDPETTYSQITARLWGKGLSLRAQVKGAEIAATHQNTVRSGQFVISKIDARHGAFGLVPPDLDGAVVSNDFPAFDIDERKAVPAYISWVSKTDWFVALCKRASEGTTNRVRLKEARFLAQEIPLPPLGEQRGIVARLDAAAETIAVCGGAADAIEAEIAAALRTAFKRMTADAPRMPMSQVAPLVRRPVSVEPNEDYTEIGVRSFYRGLFARRTIKGSDFDWQRIFRIEMGDLIFSNLMAWEQAIGLVGPRHAGAVGNHRMLTCEVNRKIATPQFIYYYFTTEDGFRQVLDASPGTMVRNKTLSTKLLPNITVPVPPLEAQILFDRMQSAGGTARDAQKQAEAQLDALLPAMLHEVFRS